MKITKEQWENIKNKCLNCDEFYSSKSKETELLCDSAKTFENYNRNAEIWKNFLKGKDVCQDKMPIIPYAD